MIQVIHVERDTVGIQQAVLGLFEEAFQRGAIDSTSLMADVESRARALDDLEARKLSPGYYVRAQYLLGIMYSNGQGVMKDAAEAAKWVAKAAEGGDPAAQTTIGVIYESGQGVVQNDAEAAKWYKKAIENYRKAADAGDASAATALGNMYARGQGVTGDYSEAAAWWRKAADTGYEGAQYNLGLAYMQGRGVPEDQVQAYLWLSLAAANRGEGQERRAKSRDALASKLTADQLAEGKRLVTEWKPKAKTPPTAEVK